MKLAAYPGYRASRADWLGEVPEHWGVKRLKWSVAGCINGVWGDEPDGVDDVVCVRVADFDRDRFSVATDSLTIRSVEPKQRQSRKLRKGDLLIEKSGGGDKQLVGCVVYFDHEFEAVCSNFVARMPVDPELPGRYWSYVHAALYAGRLNYPAIKQTTGIQNLDAGEYLNTLAAYPPVDEQENIADFLDWKTAQIDALIAKKQELIAKLKEKRLAVITQAVTKGLDPKAPLRESGISWLGKVPAHWIVGGFTKFIIHRADYRGKTPEKVRDGIFLVTARNIKAGTIDYDASQEYVLEDEYEQIMSRGKPVIGDLLFTTEAPLGEVANIDREDIALAQRVIKFRGEPDKLNNYFAKYWMMSAGFQDHLSSLATGSTAKGIKASKLFALRCVVPPLAEQEMIVKYVDRKLREFDSMEGKVVGVIAGLTEYRSALIIAATTGKIDLRDCQHAKEAA